MSSSFFFTSYYIILWQKIQIYSNIIRRKIGCFATSQSWWNNLHPSLKQTSYFSLHLPESTISCQATSACGVHPFFFDLTIKYPTPINAITATTIEILIRISNKNSTEIGSDAVITCVGKSAPPVWETLSPLKKTNLPITPIIQQTVATIKLISVNVFALLICFALNLSFIYNET